MTPLDRPEMLTASWGLVALTALLGLTAAWCILAALPRRPMVVLGGYLALVAINTGIGASTAADAALGPYVPSDGFVRATSALDAWFLWFAAATFAGSPSARWAGVHAVPGIVLVSVAAWTGVLETGAAPWGVALALLYGVYYSWALVLAARTYAARPAGSGRDVAAAWYGFMAIVVVPRLALLFFDAAAPHESFPLLPITSVLVGLTAALVIWVVAASPPETRRSLTAPHVVLLCALAVIWIIWVLRASATVGGAAQAFVYPGRWALALLVLVGGLRSSRFHRGPSWATTLVWSSCLVVLAATASTLVAAALLTDRVGHPGLAAAAAVGLVLFLGVLVVFVLASQPLSWRRITKPVPGETGRVAPGAVLHGRYEVVRLLGAGAQGRAWLAWDHADKRHLVLKEPHVHSALPQARRRAKAEADALRGCDSLHLPRVLGVVEAEVPLLAMEHVEGPMLPDTAPGPGDRTRWKAHVGAALASLHKAGFAHGDVRPENIVIHPVRGAVLLDTGCVGPLGGPGTVFAAAGATPKEQDLLQAAALWTPPSPA